MTNPAKLPPQDLDAEKGVLGSVLLCNDMLADVMGILTDPRAFYLHANALIFTAILTLHRENKPFDPITVSEALEKAGVLREVGGDDYLHELIATVPYAAHAKYYAEIVHEKWLKRLLVVSMGDTLRAAHEERDSSEVVAMLEKALHGITQNMAGAMARDYTLSEVFTLAWDGICAAKSNSAPRLFTGFRSVDRLMGGFRAGNLIVLAARPGMGKTALAIQIALYGANQGLVAFFTLEQSAEELAQRIISGATGVALPDIRNGTTLAADDTRIVQKCGDLIEGRELRVNDRANALQQISAAVRMHQRTGKLALVVLDYLQLVEPDDRRTPREQQVAQISRGLKRLAMECCAPVLVLCQLNREIEKRTGKDRKPRLSDLRESGAIEQDADIVWFLDRPAEYDDSAQDYEAKLHVAKHRSGAKGTVDLEWDGSTTAFKDPPESDPEPRQGGFFGEGGS